MKKTLLLFSLLASLAVLSGCFLDGSSGGGTATYTIGGKVSGLGSTGLILRNNGGDDLSIQGDGDFTFTTAVVGGDYAVTVASQPSDQTCRIKNGTGTIASANVNNISVTCGVDPTGYYTGSVNSDSGTFNVQVLINGTRLMIMSDPQVVLYDGDMTITGSAFTATLTIYKNGLKTGTTSASGSIVKGSQIVTTALSGSGYGNGTFVATYHLTYNGEPASLGVIGGKLWATGLNEDPADYHFNISSTGDLSHVSNATVSTFRSCKMNGTILPVGTSHLYKVNVILSECFTSDVSGSFTGLAVIKDSGGGTPDDQLVFTISDGAYSTGDDFLLQ